MSSTTVHAAAAQSILRVFDSYYSRFHEITARAQGRFEHRMWKGMQEDMLERLALYRPTITRSVSELNAVACDRVKELRFWSPVKKDYTDMVSERYEADLALTFFYSVMRRVFYEDGIPVEYQDDGIAEHHPLRSPENLTHTYSTSGASACSILEKAVHDAGFCAPFADFERDIRRATHRITANLRRRFRKLPDFHLVTLRPIFFRNKEAYLIGQIEVPGDRVPLALAFLHENTQRGITIDAVLLDEAELHNTLFTSTRSNFHVDVRAYRELLHFMDAVMPGRGISILLALIGFTHPAKIALNRQLRQALMQPGVVLEPAPGVRGSVMIALMPHAFSYVFKIIRDHSVKRTFRGRDHVIGQYRKVHLMDRVGRMLDPWMFGNVRFPAAQFSPELLDEFEQSAAVRGVRKSDGDTVLTTMYAQRWVQPLHMFLQNTREPETRRRAVLDFGQCMKDLASSGIFVGDYLTKNFGVTRSGRVVLFDFDDIDTLENYEFRELAPPRCLEEEMWNDEDGPYFYVGPNDVFPQEFRTFLGIPGDLLPEFEAAHGEIFTATYWQQIQKRLRAGAVLDALPYSAQSRLGSRDDQMLPLACS